MFFKTKVKNEDQTAAKNDETIVVSSNETITLENVDKIIESIIPPKKKTINITYDDLRQQIRELAYKKSEEAGHPWGRDREFWVEAEKELFGEEPLKYGGYCVKHNGQNALICPINSEKPVEIEL